MVIHVNRFIKIIISIFITGLILLLSFSFSFYINKKFKENSNKYSYSFNTHSDYIFDLDVSGYCYNPDYPELGHSSQNIVINLTEKAGREIYSLDFLEGTFNFIDDHYGSRSPKDTGDVFSYHFYILNKTNGEILDSIYRESSFEGGEIHIFQCNLSGRNRGTYYEPYYRIDISISNCGEYPKYWKWGFFSEPDPGNDWHLSLKFNTTIIMP